MDVRLPDGTIIRGVPDDITRDQLTAKLRANGYSVDPPAPPSKMSMLKDEAITSLPGGFVRGLKDGIDAGAGWLSRLGGQETQQRVAADIQAGNDAFKQAQERAGAGLSDVGRIGGNIAVTWPIGGALGKGAEALGLAKFGSALRTGGMSLGAPAATTLGGKAANMGIRMAGGAATGGASAGYLNPDDAALGATIGAVLPPVFKGVGAAGHVVGNAVSDKWAGRTAAGKIAQELGPDARQAVADIQTYYPKGAENIPLTAAAVTRNPALARLEQGSRLHSAPEWFSFDQRQGKAVFDNVLKATDEAGELGARKAERADHWKEAWAKAADSEKPRVWGKRMGQLGSDIEQAMKSPQASNPSVRRALEELRDEVIRVGRGFSPAHLQQIRAEFNGKMDPFAKNAFKSAPRDNPAIRDLIAEMDDILNHTTSGKWQKVLEGYAQDSQKVRASAAAGKVRGAFVDPQTGRVLGKSLDPTGDVPTITESGLGRAMNSARLPDQSLALSQPAHQRLDATLDALRRQAIVQGVKRSSTAGGGSDTVSNAVASGLLQSSGTPNLLLQLAGAARKVGMGRVDRQMAGLLSDPDELARMLEMLSRPQQPSLLAAGAYRSAPLLPTADR